MDKNEQFVRGEEDGETPKQSPGSSQTWPMEKIRQSRFQRKMSSLLSPVTPKRNYNVRHEKSRLLQCLRDSKSDTLPRRRFPASYSDDGILMDGVLVTSATAKKVSDSPSNSLGRSACSSTIRSQNKNSEFSCPRSESGRNQEANRFQQSSAGNGKIVANTPTKVETSKAANPSKLQATAEPFILTPRSANRLASPIPLQKLSYDPDPHFPCGNSPLQRPPSHGYPYRPPSYAYPRPLQGPPLPYLQLPASLHGPDLFQTQFLFRSPRPTGYQIFSDFNQSPTRISLPTTPSSSQPNTNTIEPLVHTPISTSPATNDSTSTTIHGSRLELPPSVDEFYTVTQILDLSSPSDGLEERAEKPDLSSPSDGLEAMTQKPALSSPSDELETMTTEKDWSPSDDGLPTFSQDVERDRIFSDDVFEHYKYRTRLPVFHEFCLDDKLPQSLNHMMTC